MDMWKALSRHTNCQSYLSLILIFSFHCDATLIERQTEHSKTWFTWAIGAFPSVACRMSHDDAACDL